MQSNAPKFTLNINPTIVFFGLAVVLVFGLGIFAAAILNPSSDDSSISTFSQNSPVIMEKDGKQVVSIYAKDGFKPNNISLKAGVPTVLSVKTSNTYDCSSTISIPDLKVVKALPITGETPIDIPAQSAGTSLVATCGMGHYPLTLNFE